MSVSDEKMKVMIDFDTQKNNGEERILFKKLSAHAGRMPHATVVKNILFDFFDKKEAGNS